MEFKSITAIAKVMRSDLSPSQRLVFVVYAMHANSTHGESWPGVATVCAETGLGERTVQKCKKDLVRLKWMRPTRKQRRKTQSFIVTPQNLRPAKISPSKFCAPQNKQPDPAESAPEPSMNPPVPLPPIPPEGGALDSWMRDLLNQTQEDVPDVDWVARALAGDAGMVNAAVSVLRDMRSSGKYSGTIRRRDVAASLQRVAR